MKVKWREPEVHYLLKDSKGPVGVDLAKRAYAVKVAAQAQVGVKTGALKNSIKIDNHVTTSYGQKIRVGSSLNYAYMHHEGTKPHYIYTDDAEVLRFTGGSRVLYRHKVRHPGTKPNRYLTDNLPASGALTITLRV